MSGGSIHYRVSWPFKQNLIQLKFFRDEARDMFYHAYRAYMVSLVKFSSYLWLKKWLECKLCLKNSNLYELITDIYCWFYVFHHTIQNISYFASMVMVNLYCQFLLNQLFKCRKYIWKDLLIDVYVSKSVVFFRKTLILLMSWCLLAVQGGIGEVMQAEGI